MARVLFYLDWALLLLAVVLAAIVIVVRRDIVMGLGLLACTIPGHWWMTTEEPRPFPPILVLVAGAIGVALLIYATW